MPLLPYALSIGLDRNQYVQVVNTMFTLGAIVVGLMFWQQDVLTNQLVTLSVLCVAPTFVGVAVGNAIRKRITSEIFRTATLLTLIGISMSLATRAAQAFEFQLSPNHQVKSRPGITLGVENGLPMSLRHVRQPA